MPTYFQRPQNILDAAKDILEVIEPTDNEFHNEDIEKVFAVFRVAFEARYPGKSLALVSMS